VFNNINNVSIIADFSQGKTTKVVIFGDVGQEEFDGDEFKNWFNARAPANIQIVSFLYNIEKK
jgi:hypothetical protein